MGLSGKALEMEQKFKKREAVALRQNRVVWFGRNGAGEVIGEVLMELNRELEQFQILRDFEKIGKSINTWRCTHTEGRRLICLRTVLFSTILEVAELY